MEFLILAFTLAVLNNGGPAVGTGPVPKTLADCPKRPNCVSSEARDAGHAVAPLVLRGDPGKSWEGICEVVRQLPRCEVVRKSDAFLHVIFKSRIFKFIDDLELLRVPGTRRVAIRSASRKGYSDLGVNRKRVEKLRYLLREKALID